MVQQVASFGHSSIVKMVLRIGERNIRVAQMGPNFLILKEETEHSPTTGVVTLDVDGRVREYPVFLRNGIVLTSKRVEVEKVPDPE